MVTIHECPHPGCGKRFDRKYNLKCHRRIHSDEKPYLCSHASCKRAFRWKSSLNHHLMSLDHASPSARAARKRAAARRPARSAKARRAPSPARLALALSRDGLLDPPCPACGATVPSNGPCCPPAAAATSALAYAVPPAYADVVYAPQAGPASAPFMEHASRGFSSTYEPDAGLPGTHSASSFCGGLGGGEAGYMEQSPVKAEVKLEPAMPAMSSPAHALSTSSFSTSFDTDDDASRPSQYPEQPNEEQLAHLHVVDLAGMDSVPIAPGDMVSDFVGTELGELVVPPDAHAIDVMMLSDALAEEHPLELY